MTVEQAPSESLGEEILPYVDGGGYVAPNLVPEGQERGSDNGTMFTSEYYILMERLYPNSESSEARADGWEKLIRMCMPIQGLTTRFPGDRALDAPDNFYGILAAAKVLDRPDVALDILDYGKDHFGFYNPTGSFTWAAFMWRQPQMLFAMYASSGSYRWWKWWLWPLALYTALAIAISCKGTPPTDADPRRLSWLLIQAVKDSWVCRMAAKVWTKRLFKDYPDGMRGVAAVYYRDNHPFQRYFPNV